MVELGIEAVVWLCLIAVVAGFVDAVAGGGGLLTVPALLAAGVPPVAALATNKVQGSVGTASATWSFWRAGRIDFRALAWPLAAALAGAAAGAAAVQAVDATWLLVALPILLALIALYFLFGPRATDGDVAARLRPPTYAPIAGAIGFYDGFFGPGTGSFFALSLVTLMGMGLTRATANTKALNLASSAISVVVLAAGGHVLWGLAAGMAVGQVVGARLGSHAAMRFGPRLIRPLLATVCIGMVVKLLSDPANPLRLAVQAALP